MEEHFFTCPYCFTEVSVLIDTSVGDQTYIEDCERCCNPIEFHVQCGSAKVQHIDVEMIGQ